MPVEYELIAVCQLLGKTPDELDRQPAWFYQQAAEYALTRLQIEREERRTKRTHNGK